MPERKSYAELSPEERRKRNALGEAWNQKNTRQVKFRFNLRTDADILEKLDSLDNVQGYIKSLIRADIAAHPEGSAD